MTNFDHPVVRRTVGRYRFSISGAYASPEGRRLIVELNGGIHGDLIRIREEKLQTWIELDVSNLYAQGLLAKATKKKQED